MTEKEKIEYLEIEWRKQPLHVLARKFGMSTLELCKYLRIKGISKEIKPIELQYIKENYEIIPSKEIRENLGVTSTQYSQIMQKKLRISQLKAAENLTLEEALNKTKWLIEEKLQLEIDDCLPRVLRTGDYLENNISNCLEFAETEKKKDSIFINFTGIAFLVCKLYPDKYKPFQFSYTKNNNYFNGRNAKGRYLRAVLWMMEEKLGYNLDMILEISNSKYFLRKGDLQFYGLGPYYYTRIFGDRDTLKKEFIKFVAKESIESDLTTKRLRCKLEENGISVKKCYVTGCVDSSEVEIHHIWFKENKNSLPRGMKIDDIDNLIPLCPNHHDLVHKRVNIDCKRMEIYEWRKSLVNEIEYMETKEAN